MFFIYDVFTGKLSRILFLKLDKWVENLSACKGLRTVSYVLFAVAIKWISN